MASVAKRRSRPAARYPAIKIAGADRPRRPSGSRANSAYGPAEEKPDGAQPGARPGCRNRRRGAGRRERRRPGRGGRVTSPSTLPASGAAAPADRARCHHGTRSWTATTSSCTRRSGSWWRSVAGILSFLSPCVLPLVPAYLSMMSGRQQRRAGGRRRRPDQRRLLRSTLLFVAGFTAVFAALEATASGLGETLQSHQRLLNQVAGVVIIAAGLLFAGLAAAGLAGAGAPLARGALPARRVGRPGYGHGVRLRVDALHRAGPRGRAEPGQRHPHPRAG